jgi:hypothetical protein
MQATVEFTFEPKLQKTFKAPFTTPAEGISESLMELGFDVITVKHLPTTRQSSA